MKKQNKIKKHKTQRASIHKWINPAMCGRTSLRVGRTTHYSGKNFDQLSQELRKAPIDQIRHVFNVYSTLGKGGRKRLFEGLFPLSYSRIPVMGEASQHLGKELYWACLVINLFSPEINRYISLKRDFERNLLMSNYPICNQLLLQINEEVTHSLWALQNEILLGQLIGSLEGNKKAFKKHFLNTNASIIGHYFSMCLEDKVTNDGFDIEINKQIAKWSTGFPGFCSYFSFVFDRVNFNSIDKLPAIIRIANSNSIIDFYESVISSINILISDQKLDLSSHLKSIFTELESNIQDTRWKLINNYICPDKLVTSSFHKEELIPILELYTTDNFEEVIIKCKKCLINNPTCTDLYDIYVKSLLSSNKSLAEIEEDLKVTSNDSLLNHILFDYFNIVLKSSNTSGAIARILKHSRALATLSISGPLYSFCIQHMPSKSKVPRESLIARGILNGCGGTPKFSSTYSHMDKKELFLNSIIQEYGELASLMPFKVLVSPGCQPKTLREIIYHNEKLLGKGEFDIVIHNLENLLSLQVLQIHYERIIKCLQRGYSLKRDLKKELSLLSSIIIKNKYLLQSFEINEIYARIKEVPGETTQMALEKAIFIDYYLRCLPDTKKENTERYNTYTDFLDKCNVEKPSDLFKLNSAKLKILPEQFVYFLRYIANTETLEDDWHFDNTDDQRTERINICHYLCDIDTPNIDIYHREVLETISKIEINKFIRQAESSKIFVNTTKIVNSLDENVRERCERFLSLINLPGELRKIKDFQGNDIKPIDKCALDETKDSALELFKSIFRDIVDLFVLHDEYGLDQSLSGRIRHGVFDSDLRSVFEHHQLVTKKSEGKYLQNEYWAPISEEQSDLQNSAFANLSKKVDDILEIVNKEWIQATTTLITHVDGGIYFFDIGSPKVFQYVFSDIEIEKHFESIQELQNVEELCEYIFGFLWKHTENCLAKMRWRIENSLKVKLIAILEEFQKEIEPISGLHKERLISNINGCRGELNRKISEVANWFILSKTLTHDDYELENMISSCVSIYRNWNNDCFENPDITCSEKRTFHARTFRPLFDAIFITLGNIVKHSLDNSNTTKISASTQDNILTIVVKNKLLEQTNLEDLKNRLKNEYNQYDRTALRKEGRSGFHKMWNILKNNFVSEITNFQYTIENEEYFAVTINLSIQELLK